MSHVYLRGVDALAGRTDVVFEEEDDELAEVAAELEAAERPRLVAPVRRVLRSELAGIEDDAWTDFVLAMKTQELGAVSASNELGMFGLRPRRLADLGLMRNLKGVRSPTERMIWIGEWVPPLSEAKFLADPRLQYRAFCESMKRYAAGMGAIPDGLSLSGALAVLHRCGPGGLETWSREERFPSTEALVEKTNGIF